MATYIFFWNPAISSVTKERYLDEYKDGFDNWSIFEHEDVKEDDKFYMVRCGEGNVGIVAMGTIISEAYEDVDWSPKGRKPIYYVDLDTYVNINPFATDKLLTPDVLTKEIPDFNWYGGHSGRLLKDSDAEKLDKLFESYLRQNVQIIRDGYAWNDWFGIE